ncbi:MAG: cell envelope integrity protein CreD [Zoogloeaceae bacterium]|nr:cell envelope integrity protein CreD [Zoogloeaceae bacterium]
MNKELLRKLVGIAALMIGLLLPLAMIEGKIEERSDYQNTVIADIANSAAGKQTLIGPVLAVRYQVEIPAETVREEGKIVNLPRRVVDRIARFPAENLAITGGATVETRHRGIYQARLYHLDLALSGVLDLPAQWFAQSEKKEKLLAARAVMLFGLGDLRGVDKDPEVTVNDEIRHFSTPNDRFLSSVMGGSHLELDLGNLPPDQSRRFAFSFPLTLTGTETLSIAPTARDNHVKITSDWPHPSFQGRFLPRSQTVDGKGFTAEWDVSHLSRDLDAALRGQEEILGVSFIDPVNIYLQSSRAVKYGILFITLTFAAFFLGEILRRRPMYFMQYLLVGLELTLFFLLLVALSEHLPFAWAYLVSALASVALIAVYLSGVFASRRLGLVFGGGFAVLYGVLYGVLQSEDSALLMGSLLLFATLSVIMICTRHLDWKNLGRDMEREGREEQEEEEGGYLL